MVAITPAAMKALDDLRPVGVVSGEKVFGLSESQIARRVKMISKAAGSADWELFSGHSGRVGMAQNGAPPTRSNARAAGNRAVAWSAATAAGNLSDRHCGTCSNVMLGRSANLLTLVAGVVADRQSGKAMATGTNRKSDFAPSANYCHSPILGHASRFVFGNDFIEVLREVTNTVASVGTIRLGNLVSGFSHICLAAAIPVEPVTENGNGEEPAEGQ